MRSSVFSLSKTYQCEDLASKPSVISSPFCSCLIHFQTRRYVIYYKYIFNIYKKVKSDRKSKNKNWKDNSIRTDWIENKINEKNKINDRKCIKKLQIKRINEMKEVEEIETKIRELEIKILKERTKEELEEFKIKRLKIEIK